MSRKSDTNSLETNMVFTGFDPPEQNWSKLPHQFIDMLPQLETKAELCVMLYILRHTWGYHEYGQGKRITIDEFMNGRKLSDGTRMDGGSGLSKPSIIDGLRRAEEHGFIEVDIDDSDLGRVKKLYTIKLGCKESLPQMAKNFTADEKKVYSVGKESLHRTEKETIERKKGERGSGNVCQDQFSSFSSPIGSNSNSNGSYRNTDSVGGGHRASQIVSDRIEKAKSLGFSPEGFRVLVDDLLELYGRLDIVNLGTTQGDKYLSDAQEAVLSLAALGYTNTGGFKDLLDGFPKDDWRTRSGLPSMAQLVDRAGEVASGRDQSVTAKRNQQRPSYLNIPEL